MSAQIQQIQNQMVQNVIYANSRTPLQKAKDTDKAKALKVSEQEYKESRARLLAKIEQVILGNQQWPSDKCVYLLDTIRKGRKVQIWVKNEGGFLTATSFIDHQHLNRRWWNKTQIGLYNFESKQWKFSANNYQFDKWYRTFLTKYFEV